MTSTTKSGAGALDVHVGRPAGVEVPRDAAVTTLEVLQHADHGGGGRLRDPVQTLELRLVGRLGEPFLVARPEALLPHLIIRVHLLNPHAYHTQEESTHYPLTVL